MYDPFLYTLPLGTNSYFGAAEYPIFNKHSGNQKQRNLSKSSSRKSTNTWIATAGYSKRDAKSLMMSK